MTRIGFLYFFHLFILWIGCRIGSVQASCESNPCKNGGVCATLSPGVTFCLCPRNFTGSAYCDPVTTSVPSTRPATTVMTSRLGTTNRPIKSTEQVDSVLTTLGFYRTSHPRLASGLQSTYMTTLTSQQTTGEKTTKQMANTAQSDDLTIDYNELHRSSTTKAPSRDDVTFPLTKEHFTNVLSIIISKKNPIQPTKDVQTKEWNYTLLFTWIVILLFVTSVLLLILAIALFISYGRVSYPEDEENDAHDYPPEEDDLVGKKQVFTLNFRN